MVKVYSSKLSGNCYKVRLVLTQLQHDFEVVEMDLLKGDAQTPEFKALNSSARTPFVLLDNGQGLSESNAIISYFAEGSGLLPSDPLERARVNEWLFWEQYDHEPYIAVARWSVKFLGNTPETDPRLPQLRERGYNALAQMEAHLQVHDFLAADRYTIADIALYAYTHVASDGGFDLAQYPAVQAWLKRVEATEGFVPMDKV